MRRGMYKVIDRALPEGQHWDLRMANALRSCGVLGVDLDRRPTASDWLVIALGEDELIPVRTIPSRADVRLGVVVLADPPPTRAALRVLGLLASIDVTGLEIVAGSQTHEDRTWAFETTAKI